MYVSKGLLMWDSEKFNILLQFRESIGFQRTTVIDKQIISLKTYK